MLIYFFWFVCALFRICMRLSFVNYNTGGVRTSAHAHAYTNIVPYHELSEAISEKFTIFGVGNYYCCCCCFVLLHRLQDWLVESYGDVQKQQQQQRCHVKICRLVNFFRFMFYFALNAITPRAI